MTKSSFLAHTFGNKVLSFNRKRSDVHPLRNFVVQNSARSGDLYFEETVAGQDGLPVVQWYPGHIAKSERKLKEELKVRHHVSIRLSEEVKVLDVVIEVRDARIVNATTHPAIEEWLKNRDSKKHILLLNRVDMISPNDKKAWDRYLKYEGINFHWTIGNESQGRSGILDVKRELFKTSTQLNRILQKRKRLARPPRVCVIGFPNVGKSSIVNRLLNQKVCRTAPMAGVTRHLSWCLVGKGIKGLHVLDSPGLIPTSLADQEAARKIAMCNSIGDASYVDSIIAAQLIHTIKTLPDSVDIMERVKERYKRNPWICTPEVFVEEVASMLFKGDLEQAGRRILKDFRELKLGAFALELPKVADYA